MIKRFNLSVFAATAFAILASSESYAWKPAPSTEKKPCAPMLTEWGEKIVPENVWQAYPRPQMVRDTWRCLNGLWEYTVTSNANNKTVFVCKGEILVPFSFEAPLSGVGRKIRPREKMIYSRKVSLTPKKGRRTLLNFEAVDWRAQVFVNDVEATDIPHEGGNLPFSVDITPYVRSGENTIKVVAWDPTQEGLALGGKQNDKSSGGCFYTPVSGIWQTVWLEEVPDVYIQDYNVISDIDKGTVTFTVSASDSPCAKAAVRVLENGKQIAAGVAGKPIAMPKAFKLWSPDSPHLYDFEMTYGSDIVRGYFAMRKFHRAQDAAGAWRFKLNNKFFFAIGTLDQGWWPDGLLTPPSPEACEFEIRKLKEMGFNMIRKHIKIEPRIYYHLCDKLGLVVFQDAVSPAGGRAIHDKFRSIMRYGVFRRELKEQIDHLGKTPSIVMWIPFNEGWGQPDDVYTEDTMRWIKRYDPTRLVGGPSGWVDYEGDKASPAADTIDKHSYPGPDQSAQRKHRVSILGEFGGLGLRIPGHLWDESRAWGYGNTGKVADREKTLAHYRSLHDKLLPLIDRGLAATVYTQTTDVEMEINGLITYDRKVIKLDESKLREIHEKVRKHADAKE